MKNHRFLWLRNRTTDNRKCEKARNIKEKRTIEMFSTVSKQLVALRSSARDNLRDGHEPCDIKYKKLCPCLHGAELFYLMSWGRGIFEGDFGTLRHRIFRWCQSPEESTTQSPVETTNPSSLEIANAPAWLINYRQLFGRITDFYRISFQLPSNQCGAYSQQRCKHQSCCAVDCILQILFSSYLISPYHSINYQLQKSEAFQSVHHVTFILCYTVL